ncbi:MAG: cytochrome-c peroxidase [Betaproteobacteria bacterium]|nr:cytochrome-c peroxidase [Betaproteobacteria bacterium]
MSFFNRSINTFYTHIQSFGLLAVFLVLCAFAVGWQVSTSAQKLSPLAEIGREIFHDPGLSASGEQSCATCHVAEYGHASSRGIEKGGTDMRHTGTRNVPSIRYLQSGVGLSLDEAGKASGGFFWDGRANSLETQALEPFLDSHEMANLDAKTVVNKLSQSRYADKFAKQFGGQVWQRSDDAFQAIGKALAAYETEDTDFHPFDAVFDQVMQGKARFTAAQQRGWEVFKDPEKGNCAACHSAEVGKDGTPPLFTDNSYDNLGVPVSTKRLKHQALDKGVCTHPLVRTRSDGQSLCGAFKVPSLRNVAVRRAFFHNGVLTDLREVIAFYATRDTDPRRWYGTATPLGGVPLALRANVNRDEVPYGQKPGGKPRLSEQDIDDVLAFLYTLTDADLKATIASHPVALVVPSAEARADRLAASRTSSNTR